MEYVKKTVYYTGRSFIAGLVCIERTTSLLRSDPSAMFHPVLLRPTLKTLFRKKYRAKDGFPLQRLIYSDSARFCGPGSVVGIATGYGLDGPGIESRLGRDFLHMSRPALGSTQPPVQWVLGLPRG